jgi:hypothetical protein
MNKLKWFSVGVLLVALCALSMGAKAAEAVTVEQAKLALDANDEPMMAYVAGLAQASYVSYFMSLTHVMPEKEAIKRAQHNCGNVSPQAVLAALYNFDQFRKVPVRVAIPAWIYGACHKGDVNS